MGLSKSALRFLTEEHRRRPFGARVLTLGRQNVYATFDEALKLMRALNVDARPLPPDVKTTTNIPAWIGTNNEQNLSDVAFFRLLGCTEVLALDRNPSEGAELVWDLNLKVPPDFQNRFDLIIDGGTVEHVFDIRQALTNLVVMTKSGGRIVHMSPTSNYVNHGFYQFSPTLFLDYYSINGFGDFQSNLVEHNIYLANRRRCRIGPASRVDRVTSRKALATFFVATKTLPSLGDAVPTQSLYRPEIRQILDTSRTYSAMRWVAMALPNDIKLEALGMFPWLDPARRRWKRRSRRL